MLHWLAVGNAIESVAFSRDGQLVAAASSNGTEVIWRMSGEPLSSFVSRQAAILTTEFDQTGEHVLAAYGDGTIIVTDIQTTLPTAMLEGPETDVLHAHFMPDARIIGAARNATWIWKASATYLRWSTEAVNADCDVVTIPIPDDRFVAVGCRDHPVHIWDTSTDRLVATLPGVSRIKGNFASAFPAIAKDGDRAAIARNDNVEIYELPSTRLLYRIRHPAPVNAVAFGANSHDVISGSTDGSIVVSHDDTSVALPHTSSGIDAVAMLDDGRILAADAGRKLWVYQRDGRPLASLQLPGRVIGLRSAGNRLVTVPIIPQYEDHQSAPVLLDLDRYEQLATLEGHRGRVFSARWTPTNQIITSGVDATARLWDGETGTLKQVYRGGSRYVADAMLLDDNIVVGGGADGSLRFWDTTSGQLLWALQARRAAIAGIHLEDRDIITRGIDGQVERWSIPGTGQVLAACRRNTNCATIRK